MTTNRRSRGMWVVALLVMGTGVVMGQTTAQTDAPLVVKTFPARTVWVTSSLRRVFPVSAPAGGRVVSVLAPRGGRVSFQACVRNPLVTATGFRCVVTDPSGKLKVRVRREGFVPVKHATTDTAESERDGLGMIPGLVPDPLFPEDKVLVGPGENAAFWITVEVPAEVAPGTYELSVRMVPWGEKRPEAVPALAARIEVGKLVLKPRVDFPVTHWWRAEAIWDYYKTGMWGDERLWTLMEAYLKDYAEHGNDVVYVPMFFMRREAFKRPAQLLTVRRGVDGRYTFDWASVKRFVELARRCGIRKFEWTHLWIYWGVENPIRVYTWKAGVPELLWPTDTPATGEVYVGFLRQFLPSFHEFLETNGLLDVSYFHLSDEPGSEKHVENYRKARAVLRDLAPWMKVMDALSDVRYGREHLTDMPIPLVSAAQAYIDEGIPHWVYYCCAPHGPWLNRFMDTPLAKVRMSGWVFYRLRAKGFLHWGYNYWHRIETEEILDPFAEGAADAWPGIPYGDPFVVYPGKDGPIDSIRWEVFAESLQDYAMLQSAGVSPGDPMLSEIKSYAEFPKSEEWVEGKVREVLGRKGK